MANVSLEIDVCKQAGFPVSFGGLGWRAGEIALPSSFISMNSVASWWKLLFLGTNKVDTNELAEAVESWREASAGASFSDDLRRQKAWDLPNAKKNSDNMLREADQVSLSRYITDHGAERECCRAWLNVLPVSLLGALLESKTFRVAIVL